MKLIEYLFDIKRMGSGALPGNDLLLWIIQNNKKMLILGEVSLSKG